MFTFTSKYTAFFVILFTFVYASVHLPYFSHGPLQKGTKQKWKKDEDAGVASDASVLAVFIHKLQFFCLSLISRKVIKLIYPTSLNFYDEEKSPGVAGLVCLTIDDAFCRQDDKNMSLIGKVKDILKSSQMKVTFFTTLKYSQGAWREREIKKLISDGHELGNHCADDCEYDTHSAQAFEADLTATSTFIQKLNNSKKPPKWFRAPSGKLSPTMQTVLHEKGIVNVMLDCYSNDPHIPDAEYISSTVLRSAQSGSILCIHFPEIGFREWEIEALTLILEGLKEKGLRSVTLSEMEEAAAAEGGKEKILIEGMG